MAPQFHFEASGEVSRRPDFAAMRRPMPSRWQLWRHPIWSLRVIRALLGDPGVPFGRKLLFGWICVLLALVLFVPDVSSEVAATIFPLVGNVLDVPLDAMLDWSVVAVLLPELLKLFPQEALVRQWYGLSEREL
ncbi:MAG: hypothetical protein M1396_03990 [Chloroflexi bacterium]|nr:hypothetical protein [Chloroflexota bacterium]